MKHHISILKTTRNNVKKAINGLTLEQLNEIPVGFNNNIIWNVAHLVVTQKVLVYKFSGLEVGLKEDFVAVYRKGAAPLKDKPVGQAELDEIMSLLDTTLDQMEKDFENGVFKEYQSYETSYGAQLNSVQDAVIFNNIHEGVHLGYIMALKKIVLK